jgi:hypothetical protein
VLVVTESLSRVLLVLLVTNVRPELASQFAVNVPQDMDFMVELAFLVFILLFEDHMLN